MVFRALVVAKLIYHLVQWPCSFLPVGVDLQYRFIKLGDLSVDERLQRLLQPVIVPLQLPLVLFLVWTNQALIFPQGIFTPSAEQIPSCRFCTTGCLFLVGATHVEAKRACYCRWRIFALLIVLWRGL